MRRWTRETRLLVVTIVLSVSVLLALARLRFPDSEPTERLSLPARPLQQLANRATFDDLSAAVARVAAQIRPALRVLPLDRDAAPASVGLDDLLARQGGGAASRALAIHVGDGRYVALVPDADLAGARPRGAALVGRDLVRQLLVATSDADAPVLTTSRPSLPAFLVVAEPTAAGVSVRPVFGGSPDTSRDPRWSDPVIALGAAAASSGALAFSLEGALVGAVADGIGGSVLVPADAILAAAARVDAAREPFALGVRVQPLDAGLGAALGADAGVVVSSIDEHGPATGRLQTGDVVRSVAGTPVRTPHDLLLRAALAAGDAPIDLEIVRNGVPTRVQVEPAARSQARPPVSSASQAPTPELGAVLARSARGARVVRVAAAGPARRAGVRAGDDVWWLHGASSASPAAILRAWRTLPSGGRLAVGIDRGAPVLVAIAKP